MHSNEIQMPSANQLKAWKDQYGSIFKLTLTDNCWCIVRKPSIEDISMSSTLGKGDQIKMGQLQLQSCWLFGDESIKTDYSKTLEAAQKMNSIFRLLPATKTLVDISDSYITGTKFNSELLPFVGKQLFLIGVVEELETGDVVTHQAYFSAANEDIRNAANANGDFIDQALVYAQSCYVAGDDLLNRGDEVKLATLFQCHNLFVEYESKVEKL